jgi:hypothetical protein
MKPISTDNLLIFKSFLSTPEGVLGSQIGEFIRVKMPDVSLEEIKREHGGIRRYLQSLFPGKIFALGRKGADTIWKLGESVPLAQSPILEATQKLWSLFTNPKKLGKLYILDNILRTADHFPPMAKELKRMDVSDHIKIIKDFIATLVGTADQGLFLQSLENENDYWPHFLKALEHSQSQGTDYSERWKRFRLASIERVFRTRCIESGCAESVAEELWRQLRGITSTATSKAREHVMEALGHLSESDFEQIQISMSMAILSKMIKK